MFTPEELEEMRNKRRKEREELNRRIDELRHKEWEEKGIKPFDTSQVPPQRRDHPNTMEDGTATVLWIVVMLIGSIFKGNWIIWIIATVLWAKFITRYKK